MDADYIIVGSGLTGAVMARAIADRDKSVLVIERRSHVGGNVHDHCHASGIRLHTYGPHYFRTNSDDLWKFVNRFGSFHPYEASVKAWVDGGYEQWPITRSYINRVVSADWAPVSKENARNFEEASLAIMPPAVYEKFVKGYSEKQWGVAARDLSADLAKRFDVREDDDTRLMKHKHQGIPRDGYTSFMRNMLKGIPIILNTNFLSHRESFRAKHKLIFTGPIDEFFGFDIGRLKYRGQMREHEYIPDIDYLQPCGQVNNPDPNNGPHIRTLEWKHMMPREFAAKIQGTMVTRETTVTPSDPNNYEYPFPDAENARLYGLYKRRVDQIPGLMVCGRLGEYRYLDMDQAIGRAQVLVRRILSEAE